MRFFDIGTNINNWTASWWATPLATQPEIPTPPVEDTAISIPLPQASDPEPIQLFDEERKYIKEKWKRLITQLNYGALRDFMWTIFTIQKIDFITEKPDTFFGPTLTQMVGALPAMSVMFGLNLLFYGRPEYAPNRRDLIRNQLIFGLASWSAIPAWNGAEIFGNYLGEQLELDSTSVKYFSGIFPGAAETLWQNGFLYILGEPIDKLAMLCNSLAGMVWQWSYAALADEDSPSLGNVFATATVVALSVATTTVLGVLLAAIISARIKACRASYQHSAAASNEMTETPEEILAGERLHAAINSLINNNSINDPENITIPVTSPHMNGTTASFSLADKTTLSDKPTTFFKPAARKATGETAPVNTSATKTPRYGSVADVPN